MIEVRLSVLHDHHIPIMGVADHQFVDGEPKTVAEIREALRFKTDLLVENLINDMVWHQAGGEAGYKKARKSRAAFDKVKIDWADLATAVEKAKEKLENAG